jgi:hypothetical protein
MWSATFETDLNAIIYVRDLIFSTPQNLKIDTVESAWPALAPDSLPCLLLLHPPHLVFKKPKWRA